MHCLSFYNSPPHTLILATKLLKKKKAVVWVYQWEPRRQGGYKLLQSHSIYRKEQGGVELFERQEGRGFISQAYKKEGKDYGGACLGLRHDAEGHAVERFPWFTAVPAKALKFQEKRALAAVSSSCPRKRELYNAYGTCSVALAGILLAEWLSYLSQRPWNGDLMCKYVQMVN